MSRPIALVTGASAGIGQSFAVALARSGHDLVLVARRRERLESLATRLRDEHGASSEVLVADSARAEGVDLVVRRAAAGPLALVVNNAGFGGDRTVRRARSGSRRRAALRPRPRGGSHFARCPPGHDRARPGRHHQRGVAARPLGYRAPDQLHAVPGAVYAGAKAFLLAFTEALAGELAATKVRVQVCLPGIVKTEFHEIQGMDTSKMPPRMTPDDVAQASLSGLARGEGGVRTRAGRRIVVGTTGETQREILPASRVPALATRYR